MAQYKPYFKPYYKISKTSRANKHEMIKKWPNITYFI